jgi:3',5'-cyclic AMP phosphodiesterase CpdA
MHRALFALVVAAAACAASPASDDASRTRAFGDGSFAVDADSKAVNGQSVRAKPRRNAMRIAILPDRTTGRQWGMPYLAEAVDDLSRIKPDAIFTVGDMVQGYTRDQAVWEREADQYVEAIRPLGANFFPTAGNHDVISGTRDTGDRTFAERYRARFGPLYYSVELDLATVLVLFSDDGYSDRTITLGDEQLRWLDGALAEAATRKKPIILLMHRPLWRYESAKWSERVAPLLRRSGADAVIAGHFHSLQRDRDVDGVQYHIVGTCGGMIDQHPLAGQLQHLTFVDIGGDGPEGPEGLEGSVRVWHQPVGMTLPDDFILRDDQDRVFAISNGRNVVRWNGALADPWPHGARGEIPLVVRNPIDVPIDVEVALVDGPPRPQPVEGRRFVSRTLIDALNPFVTDVESPMVVTAPARTTIAPGAEVTIPVEVACPKTADVPRAPELRVTATFANSRGDAVPVYVRTTVPLERRLERDGRAVPIQALVPSPFDMLEPDPTVRVSSRPDGSTELVVAIDDPVRPDDPTIALAGRERFTNPLHDAIRLQFADGSEFFLEPFEATPTVLAVRDERLEPTDRVSVEVDPASPVATVRLRLDPGLAAALADGGINLGVADNDFTFHTQWRWLCLPGSWARLWDRPSEASPLP